MQTWGRPPTGPLLTMLSLRIMWGTVCPLGLTARHASREHLAGRGAAPYWARNPSLWWGAERPLLWLTALAALAHFATNVCRHYPAYAATGSGGGDDEPIEPI